MNVFMNIRNTERYVSSVDILVDVVEHELWNNLDICMEKKNSEFI
jgi:hypothetical protein